MKNVLSTEKMSEISAGSFWDGVCVAVGIGNIISPFLALTGVGVVVLSIADIGCLAHLASKL
jgi:hypothetical protein